MAGSGELLETYRAEAASLLQANQEGRAAAGRVAILILTVIGAAVAAGINAHSDRLAMALPPLTLMLLAYMFQLFVDVGVTGAARAVLERAIDAQLGQPGLIYEAAVSPARRRHPFGWSVRTLNLGQGMIVFGVVVVGVYVALQGQRWYVEVGFWLTTALGLLAAALSYRDMIRSFDLAEKRLVQWAELNGISLAATRPFPARLGQRAGLST